MPFKKDRSAKSKNQFTARLVSVKTGAMIAWISITDDFARKVFAVSNATEVTAAEAEATLPSLLGSEGIEVKVTDLTSELVAIDATEF